MVCELTVIKKRFKKNSSSQKLGGQISVSRQLVENTFKKERDKNKKKKKIDRDILTNGGVSILVL